VKIAVRIDDEADAFYHVLAHVDLGRDAANLLRPDLAARSALPGPFAAEFRARIRALQADHEQAPWPAALQAVPLSPEARATAVRAMGRARVEAVEEAALVGWRAHLAPARVGRMDALRLRAAACRDDVAEVLEMAAPRLFPATPPPILLVPCESLQDAARAVSVGRTFVVACEAGEASPRVRTVLQVLHEVCHAATDPLLPRRTAADPYSTRPGDPGHDAHTARERAALAAGWLALEGSPWRPRYAAWCARIGGGDPSRTARVLDEIAREYDMSPQPHS